jgi:hypothetical protein
VSIELDGAAQFAALAKRLRAMGDKDLSREFSKAVSASTKPLVQELRKSARDTLPKRGGLAERVAKSPIRTQRRSSARAQGARVVARNPYAINRLDQGRVRHPVFGRAVWVDQTVKSGWWTRPTEAIGPEVRRNLDAAMNAMKTKLDGPL